MRIVVDTNIFVSANPFRGTPIVKPAAFVRAVVR
jgi:hypothetical protein